MLEKNYICSMRLVRQIPHEHFLISLHQYNDNYLLSITLDDYQQQFKVPVSSISDLEHLEQQTSDAEQVQDQDAGQDKFRQGKS